ncbi:MAG: citrate synthase [Azospirillaceae bacterium]
MTAQPYGLEGIVAADTVMSDVDAANGRLILRGRPLDAVAGAWTAEEMAVHLWRGFLPMAEDPTALRAALGAARGRAFARLDRLLPAAAELAPVDGLRLLMAGLEVDEDDPAPAATVVGALPVFVAALGRAARGLDPVAPDPERGVAADLLAMLDGEAPSDDRAAALDTYLVTVADHGLNASTFTARVVASTRADLLDALTAALGALKGPLHGGAPGPVLDMLDAIGRPEAARAAIADRLASGERLMGFGHRVYRGRDPRADALRKALLALGSPRLALAGAVEREALAALARHKPDRPLDTNVEYYTALLLEAIGVPRALFTPVFAVGRAVGWAAHVMEQQAGGRLIRPASRYVGPAPGHAAAGAERERETAFGG